MKEPIMTMFYLKIEPTTNAQREILDLHLNDLNCPIFYMKVIEGISENYYALIRFPENFSDITDQIKKIISWAKKICGNRLDFYFYSLSFQNKILVSKSLGLKIKKI